MLCAITRPVFFNSPSTATHFTPRRPFLRRHITMSSTSTTIEHIVLFNVKPSSSTSQLSAMVNGLNSLKSLDMVLHLSAGKLHRTLPSSSLTFTHILHSRYRTKQDLANYSSHPDHLSVVRTSVLPICDDIMAVDWVAEGIDGQEVIPPGSALRLQLVKLKDGVGEREKKDVFGGVIGVLKEKGSFGENFSPERAKGFSICSIGVFSGVHELDAVERDLEIGKEKDKVRDYIDSLLVVDYVVPSTQSASL